MPIADDWAIDYVNKRIEHVDGILPWDGRLAGNAPATGEYIRGDTSGAVGKVLAGADQGAATATGNLRLTNVVGRFQNNEALTLCSELPFDTVDNNTGSRAWNLGDTLGGATTEAGIVRATEYNDTTTAGTGTVYLTGFVAGAWANNIAIDNDTITQASVALVNGSIVNNAADTWDGVVNLTGASADGLIVPGTANTNDSIILNYDAGTVAIPEDAIVSDAGSALAQVQQVVGTTATGSLRLVDYDSTTTFADGDTITIEQVVNYDLQVAGQVFSVNDVVVGSVSGATGRVLAVIVLTATTGRLILANETGTWNAVTPDNINVGGVKIAEVANTTFTLAAATANLPTVGASTQGLITEQLTSQGGLLDTGESLNIVRSFNALYTYLQDTFDELAQLDDTVPMSAQVRDQAYTMVNNWVIPDLSLRFLEKGALRDDAGNNIWTNFQTLGSIADITSDGYLLTTANPTPQPQVYIEQSDAVIDTFWLNGNINVIVKVKSNSDVNIVDDTVPGLGQLIDSGKVTVHTREYLRTFNVFETTTIGGQAPIPLATANDLNNNSGQYSDPWNAGTAFTLIVGEEFTRAASNKRGIVTAQTGAAAATGTINWVNKATTNFVNGDICISTVTGKTFTMNGVPTNEVAGYGFTGGATGDVRIMTVNRSFTGGTTTGTFRRGEDISQAVSAATGYFITESANVLYVMNDTGTFNATGLITGGESTATYTPTATPAATTIPYDVEDDGTLDNYTGAISGNARAAGTAVTIEKVYEWCKFETRSESTSTLGLGGPGLTPADPDNARQGRIFRRLSETVNGTFTEVASAGCPIGTFAGGTMFAAQGWAVFKEQIDASDVQSVNLIDNVGTARIPPNIQTLTVSGLVVGDRAAVYRSTGAGNTVILTTEYQVGLVSGANNGVGDAQVLVQAGSRAVGPLASDVPASGVVRVELTSTPSIFERQAYTAVNRATNTFTLSGSLSETLTQGDDVFVALIEETATGTTATNSIQYVADIPLLVRVRIKGILPFETTSTFGTGGATVGAIRTADAIVGLP